MWKSLPLEIKILCLLSTYYFPGQYLTNFILLPNLPNYLLTKSSGNLCSGSCYIGFWYWSSCLQLEKYFCITNIIILSKRTCSEESTQYVCFNYHTLRSTATFVQNLLATLVAPKCDEHRYASKTVWKDNKRRQKEKLKIPVFKINPPFFPSRCERKKNP